MSVSYNPSIVTNGLQLCLDAANIKSYLGSGNTWVDLSGLGNNGILKGTTTFNDKTIDLGSSANITNYILIPNSVISNITDFTISLWVNGTSITS
jgi:hypothetical protein